MMTVGVAAFVLKVHLPEAAKETAAVAVGEFIGRVIACLLLAVVGGVCGGAFWAILSRTFALVEAIGGPAGPGIAAMTTAAITAAVAFLTYSKWARPSRP